MVHPGALVFSLPSNVYRTTFITVDKSVVYGKISENSVLFISSPLEKH